MVVLHYIFRLDHVFCLSNNLPIIQLPPSTQYLSYLQSKCMYVHEYNMNYYCNHFLSYLKSYIVCNYLTLVLFTLQPSRRQHEDSNRFVPPLLRGQRHSGAEYLEFVSSRSLKMREKYFFRAVPSIVQKIFCKSKHRRLCPQKIYEVRQTTVKSRVLTRLV